MMTPQADTIFAPATAPGRSGVAVIRVSGPHARMALEGLAGGCPQPRYAAYRSFTDSAGAILDDGIALWFPGPNSFTGEDVAEFQGHGGRAAVEGLLAALGALPGLRPAEPGEFTRRAFERGRLDLTQAEAVADLIDAETSAQRDQALSQLAGGLAREAEQWRQILIDAQAQVEADLDFSDEGDVGDGIPPAVLTSLATLRETLADRLATADPGERLRDGLTIVLMGAPNAGKSSLLNALARREAAIVSEVAGTTRDTIDVHLDLGGWPVTVTDTAGLRDSDDRIEQEGVRRALDRARTADCRILVVDGTAPKAADGGVSVQTEATPDLVVWNKSDAPGWSGPMGAEATAPAGAPLAVSSVTGMGLSVLEQSLAALAKARLSTPTDAPLTRERHRRAVADALAALDRAQNASLPELLAEDLRLAARAIGRLAGRVDVEDVLDAVFSRFCIGK